MYRRAVSESEEDRRALVDKLASDLQQRVLSGAIPSGATISNNTIGVVGGLFGAGISLNYSGNSNVLATGNILKANGYSFYISNTSDVSCLISNNRLVTSTHVATGCNQNNNY